jgi:Ran-binding protein 9/10
VSLGKSPSAALERVIQQSEVMLRELGDDGGPGAFINLKRDFLESQEWIRD